ncbi:MAG: flagellar basal body-associated FliL family protein [Rickettsiaceae bacterium]
MNKNFFEEDPLAPLELKSNKTMKMNQVIFQNRSIFRLVVIILPLLVIATGVYYFFKFDKTNVINTDNNYQLDQILENHYVELNPMIVNLLPTINSKNQHLKLTLILELSSLNDTKYIQKFIPSIIDAMQLFLMSLRSADFDTTGNVMLIKEELHKRVNRITNPLNVKEILFKEIIIN